MIQFHTVLVAGHILAVAWGLGAALLADYVVLTKMMFVNVSPGAAKQLMDLSRAIFIGLVFLWLSGALLVTDSAIYSPQSLLNQKLLAKVIIVTFLTLNAFLLHNFVLPLIKRRIGQPLFKTTITPSTLIATLSGTISVVSWFSAAFLGIARELNGQQNLQLILASYLAAVFMAWASVFALTCSVEIMRKQTIFLKRFSHFRRKASSSREYACRLEQSLNDEVEPVIAQGEALVLQSPGTAALHRPALLAQA